MLKDIENFIRNFPDKFLLIFIVLYVLIAYQTSHDTYFQRLGDTLVGGLLTLLIGKRGTTDAPQNVEQAGTVIQQSPPAGAMPETSSN